MEKLLQQIPGPGARQGAPLALAAPGPPNPRYAGAAVATSAFKRGPKGAKPFAAHVGRALYQLGRQEVQSNQNAAVVTSIQLIASLGSAP